MVTKNKICSKHGHLLDESDASHSCSPGFCGTNLPIQHTTGDEYTWAKHTIRNEYTWNSEGMAGILSQGCDQEKEVTTDLDSGAGPVRESLFQDGLLANPPTHYLDTPHLSENIRK